MAIATAQPVSTPEIMRRDLWIPDALDEALRHWTPKTDLGRLIRTAAKLLPNREMAAELIERFSRIVVLQSALYGEVVWRGGRREPLGLLGERVITTVGVGFLVDAWQNIVELEIQKYHGLGTGSTAEAIGDTALVTELTTEYTGNVRATGSLTEGATGNIFRTVGANLLDGTPGATLREHGIFSASTVGVLWDRTVFAAITLSSGDELDTTYDMSASSGG